MKQYSRPKKVIAVVLSAVLVLLFFASLFLTFEAVDLGCYDSRRDTCITQAYRTPITRNLDQVRQAFYTYDRDFDRIAEFYKNTNFEFDYYINNELAYSTRTNREILEYSDCYYPLYVDAEVGTHLVGYAVNDPNAENIFYQDIRFATFLYDMRYVFFVILALSALLFFPLFAYLLATAGKRAYAEKAQGSFIELIPFDLFTAIYVGLSFAAVGGFMLIMNDLYTVFDRIAYIFTTALAVVCYLLLLLYLVSFITRLRIGGILKTTVIWRLLTVIFRLSVKLFRLIVKFFRLIGRGFRFLGKKIRAFFRMLPLIWHIIVAMALLFVMDFIMIVIATNNRSFGFLCFYLIIRTTLFSVFLMYIYLMLRKLKKGGEAIASGDFSYQIETENMLGDLRKFGDDLNHISTSMETAVDARLKSERLKTELITNVSHDIKTPLTSIINYVDLLKKEEPESETVREYVNVLDRQSHKLKKLIGDLVEASKASTGNVAVHLEECDVGVMLEQTVGEYEEKLQKAGLSAVVTCSRTPMKIMADGRHLWRIFDNLMSNICKYSLPGTRVYLETRTDGEMGIITFKNISKSPIDISADELTERFVRADTSRNTEGSGLGLSIAQSLMKLQNGTLDIVCDGDLFKAILTFKII